VTVLKPVHGLEAGLEANLRSICAQDYPAYQVILSVQRLSDPALPLLERLAAEYGPERVSVVAVDSEPVVNGKVQNLLNAYTAARHDILVISDSDARTRPDYLRAMAAPLVDPKVGYVCSLYRGTRARRWYEKLELLGLNADFLPSVLFAEVTGASGYCLGASMAFRRADLEAVGGFGALADYLVEDYELGRRLRERVGRCVLVSNMVELIMDLASARQWWHHQIYWDQNTKAARPWGFVLTVLTRAIPFALIFAALRFFDPLGLGVLAGASAVRLGSAALVAHQLGDRDGLAALPWLPLRDLLGLASWYLALGRRSFVWRGWRFGLTRDGRIVPRKAMG
jgi:ceramide glucosyltransferase